MFDASAKPFVGLTLGNARILERTGCTVIAVERGQETMTRMDADMTFAADDVLYLCGAGEVVESFFKEFPGARIE